MGLFGDSKQDQLAAQKVFDTINDLSMYIDSNGAKLDNIGTFKATKAETIIIDFFQTCQRYQSTHGYVKWMGQKTPVISVMAAIKGFLREIEGVTGHVFLKLR